jgi:hypothetical protein
MSTIKFQCLVKPDVSSFYDGNMLGETTSVIWWSEFLATDPEVPGSIPGSTRVFEK